MDVHMPNLKVRSSLIALLVLPAVSAYAQDRAAIQNKLAPFTANHVIKFAPGTELQRAAMKKMATVRDMVDGDFVTANEDLSDDGNKEVIVMSHSAAWCGTGGCATLVLQKRPNGIAIIFNQSVFEPLAVTNEKIGTYRALAVADDRGGIVIGDKRGTPMFGKQLLYPMNGLIEPGRATPPTQTGAAQAIDSDTRDTKEEKSAKPSTNFYIPDILGIKLGVSTPLEVKAAIARQSPAFSIDESSAKLTGYISTGRTVPTLVDVPNGKYVALINAVARSANAKLAHCDAHYSNEDKVDCERIEVWFAAPPNASTARIVRRTVKYTHGPTVENVERSVIEKYGEPGFSQNADNVSYVTYPARYVWAWSANGKPFALPGRQPPHPCAAEPDVDRTVGSSFGNQNHVTALLNAGCAVVLYLNVVSKNDVVSSMTYFAVDESGIVSSNTKTAAFVSDYITTVEKKQLEDAAKVKVNP
jgi:hypothetical protein